MNISVRLVSGTLSPSPVFLLVLHGTDDPFPPLFRALANSSNRAMGLSGGDSRWTLQVGRKAGAAIVASVAF